MSALTDAIERGMARRVRAGWGSDRYLIGGEGRVLLRDSLDRLKELEDGIARHRQRHGRIGSDANADLWALLSDTRELS